MNRKFYASHDQILNNGYSYLRYRYIMIEGHAAIVVTKRLTMQHVVCQVSFEVYRAQDIKEQLKYYKPTKMDIFVGNVNVSIEFVQSLFAGL